MWDLNTPLQRDGNCAINFRKRISDSNSAPKTIYWVVFSTSQVRYRKNLIFSHLFAKNGQIWLKFWKSSKTDFGFGFGTKKYILEGLFEFTGPLFNFFKFLLICAQILAKNDENVENFRKRAIFIYFYRFLPFSDF